MSTNEEISRKILDYLRKNPDTADTLEGITEWWIESERVDYAVDEVAEILEVLLDKGLLIKTKYKNGSVVYKLAKN
jgi:Fe2+ or Zn2+ uptake regulation protein